MCMTCGCGEVDKRHHPTDITLRQAAKNLAHSSDDVSRTHSPSPLAAALPWSAGRRA